MKKILSLVLVVVMVLSLAVSSSAITIIGSDKYTGDTSTLKDLIYYLYLYGDKYDEDVDYGNVSGYDWWYGACRKCGSDAFYYRSNGLTFWKCLDDECGKHGSTASYIDSWWAGTCGSCDGTAFYYVDGTVIYWRCVEDGCGKKGSFDFEDGTTDPDAKPATKCGYCGNKFLTFVGAYIKDSKVYNEYYCKNCGRTTVKLTSGDDLDLEIGTSAKATYCSDKDCTKIAYYDHYVIGSDAIWLVYKCDAGHETKRVVSDYSWIGGGSTIGEYRVSVVSNYGGTYTVSGGKWADYNELKTVYITPLAGYAIEDVEVNGQSVGALSKLTLRVRSNTVIRVTFQKVQETAERFTITTTSTGNGTVKAVKNGTTVAADKVGVGYKDKVTYIFTPGEDYEISSVKVDGKSVGKVSRYTFQKVDEDHKLEVTFKWKSPYKDVSSNYAAAVEYVTKAGIMTYYGNKTSFSGTVKVTVQDFALALAEMVDTADALDNDVDRLKWAMKYELVGAKEDIDKTCTVQRACEMVDKYLEILEGINKIDFTLFNAKASAKDNAIAIKMVTAKIYDKNRDLNRYDLASVCRLIANLKYAD
ncbi:MAG: S-layer homology domain-containing protein [Clostridia bacterium]|nr:S-layer homology domain-containing protein [Clostridia bacterium]